RSKRDWSSDVCSSDLASTRTAGAAHPHAYACQQAMSRPITVLVTELHHSMGHYYHLWAVEGETWNRSAARAQLHPSLTMSWARRSSPGGGQWCVSVGHGRSFLVSLSVVTQDNHRDGL